MIKKDNRSLGFFLWLMSLNHRHRHVYCSYAFGLPVKFSNQVNPWRSLSSTMSLKIVNVSRWPRSRKSKARCTQFFSMDRRLTFDTQIYHSDDVFFKKSVQRLWLVVTSAGKFLPFKCITRIFVKRTPSVCNVLGESQTSKNLFYPISSWFRFVSLQSPSEFGPG